MDKGFSKNVLKTREMLKMLKVSGKIRACSPQSFQKLSTFLTFPGFKAFFGNPFTNLLTF